MSRHHDCFLFICSDMFLCLHGLLALCLVQVLGLLIEVTKDGFHTHISSIWPVLIKILQSGVDVLKKNLIDVSYEGPVSLWKESYYSLVMMEKILQQFPEMFFKADLKVLVFLLLPCSVVNFVLIYVFLLKTGFVFYYCGKLIFFY